MNTRRILIGFKYFHQCSKNMFADFYFCKVSVWSLSLVYVFVNSTKPILLLLLLLFIVFTSWLHWQFFFPIMNLEVVWNSSWFSCSLWFKVTWVGQHWPIMNLKSRNFWPVMLQIVIIVISQTHCKRSLERWLMVLQHSQSNFNAPVPHL